MLLKKSICILFSAILMFSCFSAPAFAVGEEDATTPTEKATEPPLTVENYGYRKYAEKLDETIYTLEMGAIYSPEQTTFKVWSPVAESVKVCIYKTGSDDEPGAQQLSANLMHYSKKFGAWYLTLKGDYKNLYYTYLVTVNGVSNEVVDPYAKAVGVNGDRGMIVDLDSTDPEGWDKDSFDRVKYMSDAVVWEVNIRDFSASDTSGVTEDNRGKYLAFTESGTTLSLGGDSVSTCVDYLKELGVNYVQLNPFYDFASVDESDTQSEQYNWGYDPKNYNAPEGSYSSDPYNGAVRIKECKQMIQALHKAGIGVIMDVVYNHTYLSEDSFFNKICPDYYYRINQDGSWSNGSGCGNDIATERRMVRDFIKKSVTYWAEEYHIDGFRFDLMGLMDVTTMNLVRQSLDSLKNGDRILMYGEAWNLDTAVSSGTKLANQYNVSLLSKRIGAFNDAFRDAVKGSAFEDTNTGFVQSASSKAGVRTGIEGQCDGGWAAVPNQCVNYVSCHDNLTLYDKLTTSVYGDGEFSLRREDLVAMNKLAAALVLTSRGMPFMLAGEEMGRTKLGDSNSYKSSVEINQINWSYLNKFTSLTDYYKGLIRIRKAFPAITDAVGNKSELSYIEGVSKSTIAYSLVDTLTGAKLIFAFNADPDKTSNIAFPEGSYELIADGDRAGLTSISNVTNILKVAPRSAAILVDSDYYKTLESEQLTDYVYARFVDSSNDIVIRETRYEGVNGDAYDIKIPDDISLHYNVNDDRSVTHGTFDSSVKNVDIKCSAYEGEYSKVTIRFVDENGSDIANSLELSNRVGQQYYTPYLPRIEGFSLDIDNLPTNGAGKYTSSPIEAVYHFKYTIDEVSVASPEMTCRANIIYMSEDGTVLSVKSYMGKQDDKIDIDRLDFNGYEYVSISEDAPVFTVAESNVFLYYSPKTASYTIVIIICAAALVLLLAVITVIIISARKRKMSEIMFDEQIM